MCHREACLICVSVTSSVGYKYNFENIKKILFPNVYFMPQKMILIFPIK